MLVKKFSPIFRQGRNCAVAEENKMGAMAGVSNAQRLCIVSILFYGGLSVGSTVLNKILFNRQFFDYAIVLMMLQMALTLIVLEIARLLNLVVISPYTLDRGKDMLLPSLLYCLNSYFSLTALQGMNIPMYGTLKRCVPILTLYLGYAMLKKPKPSRGVIIGVVLITIGAITASFYDLSFDGMAYFYGIMSVIFHSLYLILIERLASTNQYSTIDMIYLNSFNGLVFFLIADVIYDEIRDAFMYFVTSSSLEFWAVFIGTVVVGALLNFSIFLCTTRNSALTTSIVGNVKAALQSIIGYILGIYLFYDVVPSFWNVMGIIVNMIGCGMYTYVKSKETTGGGLVNGRSLENSKA